MEYTDEQVDILNAERSGKLIVLNDLKWILDNWNDLIDDENRYGWLSAIYRKHKD